MDPRGQGDHFKRHANSQARRFARQLNERSFDFARRERGARFVEQTTLEQFRSYVTETVMKAPQIYVQIKTLGGMIFFWRLVG